MYENSSPIVLDNGSGLCKIGYTGDEAPKSVFTSIVGKPRNPGIILGTEQKDSYIGEEAQSRRGVLNMVYPMEHGIVQNWDDMEKVWVHAFQNELRTTTEDHPIFITEASLNPTENREKMTQLMFEKFNTNSFYVGNQSVCSLYSISKTSGLVLYSGDGVTHCDPIMEGSSISQAITRSEIAGRDITHILVKLLSDRGTFLTNSAEQQIVRDIKENHCYVSANYQEEISQNNYDFYKLPDDNLVSVGNERFIAPEVMFNPELFDLEGKGIDQMIIESIMKCDIDFRKYMFENVVVSGGNTLFGGFTERIVAELHKHIEKIENKEITLKIKANPERKFSAWIGASALSGLSSFHQQWVTKSEYEETGSSIIHKKCPD